MNEDNSLHVSTATNAVAESSMNPYFLYERAMDHMDRIIKRLWVIILVLIICLIGTNVAWIYYESQFETFSVTQENEDGYNNFIGNDGDIYNGQSETDD